MGAVSPVEEICELVRERGDSHTWDVSSPAGTLVNAAMDEIRRQCRATDTIGGYEAYLYPNHTAYVAATGDAAPPVNKLRALLQSFADRMEAKLGPQDIDGIINAVQAGDRSLTVPLDSWAGRLLQAAAEQVEQAFRNLRYTGWTIRCDQRTNTVVLSKRGDSPAFQQEKDRLLRILQSVSESLSEASAVHSVPGVTRQRNADTGGPPRRRRSYEPPDESGSSGFQSV